MNTNMNIKYDDINNVLILSKKRYNEFLGKDVIEDFIKLKEESNLILDGFIFLNVTTLRNEISEDFIHYTFSNKINYIDYLKSEFDIKDMLYIYEQNEPWFEFSVDCVGHTMIITYDYQFSKLSSLIKNGNKNILFIPKNKKHISKFRRYYSNYLNSDDTFNTEAIILKNIQIDDIGLKGLNRMCKIKYQEYYILTKGDIRKLKINSFVI